MRIEERLNKLQAKYPGIPRHALPVLKRGKKQSPSNQLTDDVIRYLKSIGGIGYRINVQGQWDSQLQKWRPSGMKRGLPDCIGLLPNGRFIGVEIKIGRDKMSEFQEMRRKEIINLNGLYIIARNLEDFITDLEQLINKTQ